MYKYIVLFAFVFASCTGSSQRIQTPEEFINYSIVKDAVYSSDSLAIIKELQIKLKNHQASFYSKEYFDSTQLIIDTIIYNTSKNKMAVFVLVENPIARQSEPNKEYTVYYNAYCYLVKRNTLPDVVTLKWFNTFYPINFYSKKEIKEAIRNLYFYELATIVGGDNKAVYVYNLNDKRFWEGPGWIKIFE